MKKILLVVLLILFFSNNAFSKEIQNKKEINDMYLKLHDIMYSDSKEVINMKLDIAMDYAVEILEKSPWSLEAYYVEKAFIYSNYNIASNDNALKKYVELRNKFEDNLDNRRTDSVKKLLYIAIYLSNHYVKDQRYFERFDERKTEIYYMAVTNNIIRFGHKISTQALANLVMSHIHMFSSEYSKEFIRRFPNHPARPMIELKTARVKFLKPMGLRDSSSLKDIEIIIKLVEKYGDIMLPLGWKFKVECYSYLAKKLYYADFRDEAQKYILLVKENAPDNFSDLKVLNEILNNIVCRRYPY
jgi:hypothetical protein